MTEEKFDKLVRYAKHEERERILGIIEFYIGELGDTTTERVLKRTLDTVIKMIENPR